jgi:hypothetical protein
MSAVGNFVSAHTMKADRGIGGVVALIVNLGTKFMWVVNFTPSSTLPLRKIFQFFSISIYLAFI